MSALFRALTLAVLAVGAVVILTSCDSDRERAYVEEEALTIGYLGALTGGFAETAEEIRDIVVLAVEQVNDAGGVGGREVRLVVGDTALNAEQGLREARRLIEEEGAAAIVGPLASSVTLPVAEQVAAVLHVPFITPSGTSPALSQARDADFLFRATLSDAAQGAVLADLVLDDGVTGAGVLYIDDPYGRGLFEAFRDAYSPEGVVAAVSHAADESEADYVDNLESVKMDDTDALIAISFPDQARVYLQQALEEELFSTFYFVDGTQSLDLIDALPELEGSKGTGSPVIPLGSLRSDFRNRYGRDPKPLPFLAEAYDAAVALMLAAEMAGSTDGSAIRDALRVVASPEGEVIEAGVASLTRGFELVRQGAAVNYEGVATSLDWDENGDVLSGSISVWQYEDGDILELEVVPVDLRPAGRSADNRDTLAPDPSEITFSDLVEGHSMVLTPTEGVPVCVRFTGPWRFASWDHELTNWFAGDYADVTHSGEVGGTLSFTWDPDNDSDEFNLAVHLILASEIDGSFEYTYSEGDNLESAVHGVFDIVQGHIDPAECLRQE